MAHDFDEIIDRSGTHSTKWEEYAIYGDIIPMTVADMDFFTPECVIDAVKARAAHGIYGYTAIPDAYYRALSNWIEKRFSWKVDFGWVRFSPGVIPALNFCVQAFTEPGDGVIIQPPVYYPFRYAIEGNSRKIVNNPLRKTGTGYSMDFDGLARAASDEGTRMIIISSPHNPVGRVWRREELEKLAEVCLENGVLIISDEIHFDLTMPGAVQTPTASLSEEVARRTITCTSPSKTFNTAELHVANVIIPDPDLRDEFTRTLERAGITRPNVLGAAASTAAYTGGGPWLEDLLGYLYENYLLVREHLEGRGVELAPLEGTYLAWMDLRGFGSEEEVKQRLIGSGVALTPGSVFGPGGEGFFRMNLAYPKSVVKEALKRMDRALS